jgi:putative FmdB family regulatory protein
MPIYEFECTACKAIFDRLQKLSDPDPVECPECGKPRVKRRLTAPAFRLAGSGWYETDFKKEGDTKRNLAKADEPAKSKDESKPGAKADTGTAPAPAKSEAGGSASSRQAPAAPAAKSRGSDSAAGS